uniref:Uncharacterized protein n=1 Tax=Mycena chlorophos TaxID=658473 RepID=A0ABQ0LWF6_MYCCL|nr:predicted protein [Mycena chlorophos]
MASYGPRNACTLPNTRCGRWHVQVPGSFRERPTSTSEECSGCNQPWLTHQPLRLPEGNPLADFQTNPLTSTGCGGFDAPGQNWNANTLCYCTAPWYEHPRLEVGSAPQAQAQTAPTPNPTTAPFVANSRGLGHLAAPITAFSTLPSMPLPHETTNDRRVQSALHSLPQHQPTVQPRMPGLSRFFIPQDPVSSAPTSHQGTSYPTPSPRPLQESSASSSTLMTPWETYTGSGRGASTRGRGRGGGRGGRGGGHGGHYGAQPAANLQLVVTVLPGMRKGSAWAPFAEFSEGQPVKLRPAYAPMYYREYNNAHLILTFPSIPATLRELSRLVIAALDYHDIYFPNAPSAVVLDDPIPFELLKLSRKDHNDIYTLSELGTDNGRLYSAQLLIAEDSRMFTFPPNRPENCINTFITPAFGDLLGPIPAGRFHPCFRLHVSARLPDPTQSLPLGAAECFEYCIKVVNEYRQYKGLFPDPTSLVPSRRPRLASLDYSEGSNTRQRLDNPGPSSRNSRQPLFDEELPDLGPQEDYAFSSASDYGLFGQSFLNLDTSFDVLSSPDTEQPPVAEAADARKDPMDHSDLAPLLIRLPAVLLADELTPLEPGTDKLSAEDVNDWAAAVWQDVDFEQPTARPIVITAEDQDSAACFILDVLGHLQLNPHNQPIYNLNGRPVDLRSKITAHNADSPRFRLASLFAQYQSITLVSNAQESFGDGPKMSVYRAVATTIAKTSSHWRKAYGSELYHPICEFGPRSPADLQLFEIHGRALGLVTYTLKGAPLPVSPWVFLVALGGKEAIDSLSPHICRHLDPAGWALLQHVFDLKPTDVLNLQHPLLHGIIDLFNRMPESLCRVREPDIHQHWISCLKCAFMLGEAEPFERPEYQRFAEGLRRFSGTTPFLDNLVFSPILFITTLWDCQVHSVDDVGKLLYFLVESDGIKRSTRDFAKNFELRIRLYLQGIGHVRETRDVLPPHLHAHFDAHMNNPLLRAKLLLNATTEGDVLPSDPTEHVEFTVRASPPPAGRRMAATSKAKTLPEAMIISTCSKTVTVTLSRALREMLQEEVYGAGSKFEAWFHSQLLYRDHNKAYYLVSGVEYKSSAVWARDEKNLPQTFPRPTTISLMAENPRPRAPRGQRFANLPPRQQPPRAGVARLTTHNHPAPVSTPSVSFLPTNPSPESSPLTSLSGDEEESEGLLATGQPTTDISTVHDTTVGAASSQGLANLSPGSSSMDTMEPAELGPIPEVFTYADDLSLSLPERIFRCIKRVEKMPDETTDYGDSDIEEISPSEWASATFFRTANHVPDAMGGSTGNSTVVTAQAMIPIAPSAVGPTAVATIGIRTNNSQVAVPVPATLPQLHQPGLDGMVAPTMFVMNPATTTVYHTPSIPPNVVSSQMLGGPQTNHAANNVPASTIHNTPSQNPIVPTAHPHATTTVGTSTLSTHLQEVFTWVESSGNRAVIDRAWHLAQGPHAASYGSGYRDTRLYALITRLARVLGIGPGRQDAHSTMVGPLRIHYEDLVAIFYVHFTSRQASTFAGKRTQIAVFTKAYRKLQDYGNEGVANVAADMHARALKLKGVLMYLLQQEDLEDRHLTQHPASYQSQAILAKMTDLGTQANDVLRALDVRDGVAGAA